MLRFTIPFRPMSVCTISLNHPYLTLSGSHVRTHPSRNRRKAQTRSPICATISHDDVYAPTETLSRHRKSVPYTLPFLNHLRLTLRMTLRKPHPNASKFACETETACTHSGGSDPFKVSVQYLAMATVMIR